MTDFNIHHGFCEALVRGMRSSFLSDADYHHLTQCENLDDIKLNLNESDYSASVADTGSLTPSGFQSVAVQKVVSEFKYLRSQAVEPLTTFLDFITYEYMIENIMLLLKGALSGRNINELLEQCHPLGMFKESTMRSIPSFEPNARGFADLYQTVLVDTPVGPYFALFLQESSEKGGGGEVRNVIEEVEIEIIKSSLIKYWIEDFFQYCDKLGGDTAQIMGELLKVRADTNAINITLNSFGTSLNDPAMRISDRKRLYPSVGHLYPAGTSMLADVSNEEELGRVLELFPQYSGIWNIHSGGNDKSIDDAFYERDVQMLELAFEGQMHFGVFYAYVKLKEQEIRNLVWITECVLQQQKDEIEKFVPVFSFHAPWRASGAKKR